MNLNVGHRVRRVGGLIVEAGANDCGEFSQACRKVRRMWQGSPSQGRRGNEPYPLLLFVTGMFITFFLVQMES